LWIGSNKEWTAFQLVLSKETETNLLLATKQQELNQL
jgi:hypothetical protein